MKTNFFRKLALPLLCFALFQAQSAHAETTECTEITALPITITSQGVFCLKRSIGLSPGLLTGAAIDIQTNNVIIDLNGFKIGNLSAGTGTEARGIQAFNRKNIVIKNGTVRGFSVGINLNGSNSSGHVVKDMLLDQNTLFGIFGQGTGFVIQRNHIVLIGGSTIEENDSAFGITLIGSNMRVLDNEIAELFFDLDGTSQAISMTNSSGSVIQNNRISNEQSPTSDLLSIGIFIILGDGGTNVRDNHILNFSSGISYFDSFGIYSGNQVFGANVTSFSGGTDGGNNASANTSIVLPAQPKSISIKNSMAIKVEKLRKAIELVENPAP